MFEKVDHEIVLVGGAKGGWSLSEAIDLRVSLNNAIRELQAAEHYVHPTNGGLCSKCGGPAWNHSVRDHEYIPSPAIRG